MKEKLIYIMIILGIIGLFASVIYFKTSVWRECRAADHSIFYCWSMVNR